MYLLTIFSLFCLLSFGSGNPESRPYEMLFRYHTYQLSVVSNGGVANSEMCRGVTGSMPDGSLRLDEFHRYVTNGRENPTTTASQNPGQRIDIRRYANELSQGRWNKVLPNDKRVFTAFSHMGPSTFPKFDELIDACVDINERAFERAKQDVDNAGNDNARRQAAQQRRTQINDLITEVTRFTEYMEKGRYKDHIKYVKIALRGELQRMGKPDILVTRPANYDFITWSEVDIRRTANGVATTDAERASFAQRLGVFYAGYGQNLAASTVEKAHWKALQAARGVGARIRGICDGTAVQP